LISLTSEEGARGHTYRYKKAGVMLLDLHPAAAVQAGFFDQPGTDRRVTLMRTLDRLNLRFGRDTMTFAAAAIKHGCG